MQNTLFQRRPKLLPSVMLLLPLLGAVLGVLRAVITGDAQWWILLLWLPALVWPVLPCLALIRRLETDAHWPASALAVGGLFAALTAAYLAFMLLAPEYNRDANIGLGIYVLFGWLVPVLPAFGLGALLGYLLK